MEVRPLGKIGRNVTVVTLGGCGLGQLSQEQADSAVALAMDYSINMIDVAPSYGNAEARLAPWVEKYRDQFFIAEKTMERTKEGAWKELNCSLKTLGAKYFDLYQFHGVSTMEELQQITGKNGALETFTEAKEIGLINAIGLTCHADMRIPLRAVDLIDLDTVLVPVNVAALAYPHPTNDFRPLLEKTGDKTIGVTAIKAIAKRRWMSEPRYNTWYEPLDDPEWVTAAVNFTLSQKGVTTYPLPCDVRLWPLVLKAGETYSKMNEEEQRNFINRARTHGFTPLYPE